MVQMKKLNNKGFSLVELIIVIAIMAILVGVVGTQVIPYLENSRKAKDQQVISSWNTAGMSAYSNAAAKIDATAKYVIVVDKKNNKVDCTADPSTAKGATEILNYFKQLTGMETKVYDFSKMESKAGKAIESVTITISPDGSIITETKVESGKGFFDPIEN
jgi:type IV pilus assembly protein PilA